MAFGKMNATINIVSTALSKDAEGFATAGDTVLATARAYKETRNTTARWERIIGNAAFTSVTAMFRFRKIPGLTVDATLFICDADGRYNIVSAEDVRGRGMYIEVLAEKNEGSKT
jgi:hypothetical protein